MLATAPARAHFLWARLTLAPESKVTVSFTEKAEEKTLPNLLERIQPDRLVADGITPLTLKSESGACVAPVSAQVQVVGAAQKWGVLDRENGKNAFLLQYYAKAARNAEAAAQKASLHVEVYARKQGAEWIVSVLHGNRPEAEAEILIAAPGQETPLILKTDTKGEARFRMTGSGLCAIRARVIEQESGSYQGKNYTSKRYYSTLTFPVEVSGGVAAKADPDAFALLKAAHDRRCTMPTDFPGFAAEVLLNDNGIESKGTLVYRSDRREITLKMEGAEEKAVNWLRQTLTSAIMHRRSGDFTQGDGKHALTFGSPDRHPLGRKIALNDKLQSYYRVKDNQITEVTRTMGDSRFSITILENEVVEEGKYLPRHFVVSYFHAKSGALERSESFSDRHTKFEGAWLPTERRVLLAANGEVKERSYRLLNLRLLSPADRAASP